MFPQNKIIKKAIEENLPIAELEYLGLSLRVINSLEESKYKIVYLKDLFNLNEKDLKSIPNLGSSGFKQIELTISNLENLENEKNKWHGI